MNFFRKRDADHELDSEFRFHLDQQIAAHIASGLAPEEARRRALLEFGGLQQTKESVRDMKWFGALENIFRDIHFGLRQLCKNPGFTAVAILTLGIGIGANTAIFSVVYGALLRPLPFLHPERIVQLTEFEEGQSDQMSVTATQLRRLQDFSDSFENIAGYTEIGLNLTSLSGAEHLRTMPVSANFFSVLGIRPARGRDFSSDEDVGTGQHVVIISYDLWIRRLAGDPTAIGRQISLSGEPYTLIGIMPKGFDSHAATGLDPGLPFDVWAPLSLVAKTAGSGENISVIARLKPQTTPAQLSLQMNQVSRTFRKEFPSDMRAARSLLFVPFRDSIGAEIRPYLLLLFGAIGFVLLIACANVASLSLARGEIRSREIAVRCAVGASSTRIFGQLLVESLLVSLSAGIFGLVIGKATLSLFLRLAPLNLPRVNEIRLDGQVLCFTFFVSVVTGILFGTAPSLYSARSNIANTLKESLGKASAGHGRARLRRTLVVAEFALSLILLSGAGLMIATFARLLSVNPGFDPRHVITMQFWLSGSRHKTTADIASFYRNLEQRVASVPGVQTAGIVAAGLPFERGGNNGVRIAGTAESDWRFSNYRECSPNYFRAMGIALRQGREFLETDTEASAPIVVVNETFARRYLDGQNVLDRQVYINGVLRRVVGVVGDVRSFLDKPPSPSVFVPSAQASFESSRLFEGWFPRNIVARTFGQPAGVGKALRDALASVDPQIPSGVVLTMDQKRSQSLALQRFLMSLLSIFGGLALFLAGVGMYGVIAYTVSQRTREFGIRMALGAPSHAVLRAVLSDCLGLVLLAAVIGLAGIIALRGALDRIIFGINPTNPVLLFAATVLLICVALLACYLPARRATRVDPVVALRYE